MSIAVAIQTQLDLETIECCKCGVIYAITSDLNRNLLKTKDTFYCPNGHPQSYRESTVERLQRELAAKEQVLSWERERAKSLEKQLATEKRAATRLKRRVSVGVCPCCHRTVSQLARHMQTRHPEFVQAQQPAEAR